MKDLLSAVPCLLLAERDEELLKLFFSEGLKIDHSGQFLIEIEEELKLEIGIARGEKLKLLVDAPGASPLVWLF